MSGKNSKTVLYLVRHGQSVTNIQGRVSGHIDVSLTSLGELQANVVAQALKNVKFSAIYSSDLIRAKSTAEKTAFLHNLSVITSKELREIYLGKWEGKTLAEISERYGDAYQNTWIKNFGFFRAEGGESVEEVFLRAKKELEKIAKLNLGKNVVIFTHGCFIRTIFAGLNGLLPTEADDMPWATNASYSTIIFDGKCLKAGEYSVDSFMDKNMISTFEG